MQQNSLMSASNLVAGVQRSRAQLNQIGFHTVIQISLESNLHKPNMLTWAEFLFYFFLFSPHLPLPPKRHCQTGGAGIKNEFTFKSAWKANKKNAIRV